MKTTIMVDQDQLILDLVLQGCYVETKKDGRIVIDHMCLSAYEEATDYLADLGIIKKYTGRLYIYKPRIYIMKQTIEDNIKTIYDRRQKAHNELLACDIEIDRILHHILDGVCDGEKKEDELEVFEIEVDGTDPRWQEIDSKKYWYCYPNAYIRDFPIRSGKRIVKYVLISFDENPTTQQVIDEIQKKGFTRPDRAITETILDGRKAECVGNPIVGVCGVVRSGAYGDSVVGYVFESASGRGLSLRDLQDYWPRSCRFVAVVSE